MCQVGAVWASWMETQPEEWKPIATAPRDGTEVLVVPDSGYDRALFQDGFWFWSTPDNESTAAGPEPKGWKPLPFNAGDKPPQVGLD